MKTYIIYYNKYDYIRRKIPNIYDLILEILKCISILPYLQTIWEKPSTPEYTDRCTSAAKRGKRLIFQLREEICFSRLCFNYITTFTKLVMEIGKLLI